MRSDAWCRVGLAQRVAGGRVVDHLAVPSSAAASAAAGDAGVVTPRLYCQTPDSPAHMHDARARGQPVELARRRNRPLPQQALAAA